MSGDDREKERVELLTRVDYVAKSPASLDAMYALAPGFVYFDDWLAARDRLRDLIVDYGQQAAWSAQLRLPPPNLKLWVPFAHRNETTDASLDAAAKRWAAAGTERIFKPHHHVPQWNDGVAALHITLLSEFDPVGAVEYAANLPDEYLIWPAVSRLQIHERPDLVDRVLAESTSTAAVLTCLACELDAQRGHVWKLGNDLRWHAHDEGIVKEASVALERAWNEIIPRRFEAVAKRVVTRPDAGAIVSSFMRHLARSLTREGNPDLVVKSRVVRIALDALLAAVPGSAFEIERAERPDAACVVARILVAVARRKVVDQWDEWIALLLNEDRSLDGTNEIYWGVAGTALRQTGDPFASWAQAVRRLEPLMRRRARRGERDTVDPCVHLTMTAVSAAAGMRTDGRQLWSALYEQARRHFFVDSPPENEFGYRLSSYVFGAYPKVFGNLDNLEAELALLPTAEHVQWAREQVDANQRAAESVPPSADAVGG